MIPPSFKGRMPYHLHPVGDPRSTLCGARKVSHLRILANFNNLPATGRPCLRCLRAILYLSVSAPIPANILEKYA